MISLNITLDEHLENKLQNKLIENKLTISEYTQQLIKKDLDSIIKIGEGFYYNSYKGKLFDSNGKEIKLTNIQINIFLLLLERNGEIVTTEEMIQKIWKRRKASIFTFRNMIKGIRDKTYYELIKSHSNLGYSINI